MNNKLTKQQVIKYLKSLDADKLEDIVCEVLHPNAIAFEVWKNELADLSNDTFIGCDLMKDDSVNELTIIAIPSRY